MIENQAVLRINLFSYTFAGDGWLNQDWLSELALAGAYVGGGWSAVLVLAALAAGLAAGLAGRFLAEGRRAAITGLWLGLTMVAAAVAIKVSPALLALPCLVLWTGMLVRSAGYAPPLKLLPVMLLWANLSNSFVLGLILTGVFTLEAVVFTQQDRFKLARAWAVFAGIALMLSLATPTGVFGLVHAVRLLRPGSAVQTMLPLLVGLPAAAMLMPRRRMLPRLAFIAGLFGLALTSASAALAFAFVAPLLAAEQGKTGAADLKLRPLLALIALVVMAAGVRIGLPLVRGDDATTPKSALAQVPVALKRQPVLNERDFGGFLIFREIKPFIDNRPLYSVAFRRRYHETAVPALLAATLTRYHVRWTILKPGNPAVAAMDGLPGWHRLYADQWAVVHVKSGAP